MEKYINYEMCKQCGGVCCKQCGCIYMPDNFKNMDFNSLKKLIDGGNISIAGAPIKGFCIAEAWSFLLYLRARNVNAEVVDLFSTGSPCKMLTEKGCPLTENKRPKLGLLVKPTVIGGPCEKGYSLEDVKEEWIKYNEVLEKLVKYYTNKDVIDVIAEQISMCIKPIKEKMKNNIELSSMELSIAKWYFEIMVDRPYYTPEEVKVLEKCIMF